MNHDRERVQIWDLLVRLFHWLFAAGFLTAFSIAKFSGEDSSAFPFHSIIGFALASMVVIRIAWGLVGTRWARFSSLQLGAREQIDYLKSVVAGNDRGDVGHNPATGAFMLGVFSLTLGIGVTGYLMSTGSEGLKDIHEIMAFAVFALAVVHVLGVLLHVSKTDGSIVGAMFHGRKWVHPSDANHKSGAAGIAFLAIVGLFTGILVRNYDPVTRSTRLPFMDSRISLAESGEDRGDSEKHLNSGNAEHREED